MLEFVVLFRKIRQSATYGKVLQRGIWRDPLVFSDDLYFQITSKLLIHVMNLCIFEVSTNNIIGNIYGSGFQFMWLIDACLVRYCVLYI